MPTVPKEDKILVTGASGFVAVWVVRALLERGYTVRGTVRSEEKGKYLLNLFKPYGSKFEIAVVPDIAVDGAFDEAVKGVHAVAHTASPFHAEANNPAEIIEPAVKGTTGILSSILQTGSSVKRVIVLSSVAAIVDFEKSKLYTEDDWSENSITVVDTLGSQAPGFIKYMASKTLAEKAAWKVYKEHQDKVSWDLVVLNPPYVYGPILHEVSSVEALNTSSLDWYRSLLVPGTISEEAFATQGAAYIDVRDLAEAHALAFEKAEAGGERMIVFARTYVWQDFADAAHRLSPSPVPGREIPKGIPGAGATAEHGMSLDAAKAGRILGLKYKSIDETTRDTLEEFQRRGW